MSPSIENMHATFESIQLLVCNKLKHLSPDLTYHNIGHTLDVLEQSERIARKEGISAPEDLYLVKVAALYHDTGFLNTYFNHEEESCRIFLADARQFDFTEAEQNFITRLIMVTKIPQQPANLFENVVCDADLDYLGRADFFSIGDGLRKEFLKFGVVSSNEEWEALQIKFLTNHRYHTETSKQEREEVKNKNLQMLL